MLRTYAAAGQQRGSVAWEQQSIAAKAWTEHERLMDPMDLMLHGLLLLLCKLEAILGPDINLPSPWTSSVADLQVS